MATSESTSFFSFLCLRNYCWHGLLVQSSLNNIMMMGCSNIATLAIGFTLCFVAIVHHVESTCLEYEYYNNNCPRAETIIHDTMSELYEKKGNIATSLITYVFHDCFDVHNLLLDTMGVATLPFKFSCFSITYTMSNELMICYFTKRSNMLGTSTLRRILWYNLCLN